MIKTTVTSFWKPEHWGRSGSSGFTGFFLNGLLVCLLSLSSFAAGIPFGASGTGTLTFGTFPPATEWTTTNMPGNSGTTTDLAGLDTMVNTFAPGGITTPLGTVTADPAGTTTTDGRWNSAALRLTSRSGTTAATCFMATLENTSGAAVNAINIRFTLSGSAAANEDAGLAGYALYSRLAGAAAWQRIGVYGTSGPVLIENAAMSGTWAAGGMLYLLWMDDNGVAGGDGWWGFDDVSVTKAAPAADIITFGLPGNPATITGTAIALTVPYSTNLTALAPAFTMSGGAVAAPASGTARDFSTPQSYSLTSSDGLITKVYTATVTRAAASSAKDIITFGPGAAITGTAISWTVPFGTSVLALAPDYSVSPLATGSPASMSSRNFTTPQTYTVTAEDGTTKVYTVTVTVAPFTTGVTFSTTPLSVTAGATGAEILNNGTLIAANHVGNGGQTAITLANGLVFGTATTHLVRGWNPHNASDAGVATITNAAFSNLINSRWWVAYTDSRSDMEISGLVVGNTYRLQLISILPNSGTVSVEGSPETTWTGNNTILTATWTANDTTLNMQYSRKQQASPGGQGAEVQFNGYALHDITQPGSLKNITAFTFPTLGAASIGAGTVFLTVPYGTDVTALAPAYTVSPNATGAPVSGTTRDFTTAQTYTITAQNGSTKDYTVTVNVTPVSTAKDILGCTFGGLGAGVVSGTTVTLTVPPNQPVTALTPTLSLSPFATISPASGVSQDFSSAVPYTVTAQDGSTKVYSVVVQSYQSWANSASFYILTTPEGANLQAGVTETNFPLLVRFKSSNFNFAQAQADGRDLRFTTAAGAALSYQIEQWDPVNGAGSVWLRIPTITGNSRQEIKMYWGKAGVPAESNGAAVFNAANGFASVLHMSDVVQDAAGTVTATDSGTTPASGVIGKGRNFASGKGIHCGDTITGFAQGSAAHSTQAWFRTSAVNCEIVDWGVEGGGFNKVQIRVISPPRVYVDGNFASVTGTTPLTPGQWVHVVHTHSGGVARIYVNGQLDATNNVTMNMPNPSRMWIGGWYGTYSFAGDIDEVRVSKVARSANWIKLEYENQKPLQTLTGTLVPAGSTFAASPTTISLNEGTSGSLSGEAGGAQKVLWIKKQNGQETVLAVDQFSLGIAAGRVVGNESYVIQFKAVYPGETKTVDIPVTITEDIPEPVFTLNASTTNWDGRQPMTLAPVVSNLATLLAKGSADFNYTWSVNGVAVSKQITSGLLTLRRSQGSGAMTVKLVMDNGSAPVSRSVVVNVQEPATDSWVQRVPPATEKVISNQFIARDETGFGKIYYNGTLAGSPASVFLKIYTTHTGSDVLYSTQSQPLNAGSYAFTAPVAAGKYVYKVVFGSTTNGVDTVIDSPVTGILCGDAYAIHGQSNAEATAPGGDLATNPWIRTYGTGTSGWGPAVRAGSDHHIGYWGMDLALWISANYGMPVCIINGGVGGTRIDQHQANPVNHFDTSADYALYGNFISRVAAARLTHGIRALLWHQGEQDQGSGAPTGDYDWKTYQQYFVDLSADWKQDMPNLRYYYIYQIWPAACGDTATNDMLREVQRTLPYLYSNMRIMTTHGISPGSSCHYEPAGYKRFADLISPLLEKDLYGLATTEALTAPDIRRVYYTTAAQNEIALEFGQPMTWTDGAAGLMFLDDAGGKVISGSASGSVIKLQLTAPSTAQRLTYLKGTAWNGDQNIILRGTNLIAALTFANVPIAAAPGGAYGNWAASALQGLSAGLNDEPLDDPDHDTIPNLMEFVLGGAPMTSGHAILPALAKSGSNWLFEYERSDFSLGETIQIVEYGSELDGWTQIPIPATSAGGVTIVPGTPADRVSVVIPASGREIFVRLKVQQ